MQDTGILKALAILSVVVLPGCDDDAIPTATRAPLSAEASVVVPSVLPDTFLRRAPIDAFFINQPSDVMIRTHARSDLIIQRLVTPPGPGGWHTHPGPSFGIVEAGEVRITRYSDKTGCVATTYRAGDAYYEVANEVHRADVVSTGHAVEYKVRFYTPVGGAFGNPVLNGPTC